MIDHKSSLVHRIRGTATSISLYKTIDKFRITKNSRVIKMEPIFTFIERVHMLEAFKHIDVVYVDIKFKSTQELYDLAVQYISEDSDNIDPRGNRMDSSSDKELLMITRFQSRSALVRLMVATFRIWRPSKSTVVLP